MKMQEVDLIIASLVAITGAVLFVTLRRNVQPEASAPAWTWADAIEPEQGNDTSQDAPEPVSVPSIVQAVITAGVSALQLWKPPAKYADTIAAAEVASGLPVDMLARLLWQESHYRDDIITGRTKSPAGALGIAQFMPATAKELNIDPLNTEQAIYAAARYLATLYRRFGNWSEALAAYNWGQGNVQRKGLAKAPKETRDYYAGILADVNNSNGTDYA